MLQLDVILEESFDESTSEFVTAKQCTLKLEHSLVSLSKWESKYEKPFLAEAPKSEEEIIDYVMMMSLDEKAHPEAFVKLTTAHFLAINDYINAKMTATWFNDKGKSKRQAQAVTSELIYYWITSYEIPWDVEYWHLGRLFTLIKVFQEERSNNGKDKPNRQGTESMAAERRRINEERKAQMQTSG